MIDHIGIHVSDFLKSKVFYQAALEPLGFKLMMEIEGWAGFGHSKPDFWIIEKAPCAPPHIAFRSPDRACVDAFYAAALSAGAIDNGPPGLREIYHPNYYGAFVLDPDGNNIEAVCHLPE